MKTFKGNRSVTEIKQRMKKLGYHWTKQSQNAYAAGSDYMGFENKNGLFVLFSTFNGQFSVKDLKKQKIIATHMSTELDDKAWYSDILDALYEPLPESKKQYIIKIDHQDDDLSIEVIEMNDNPTSSDYDRLLNDSLNICRYVDIGIPNGVALIGDTSLLRELKATVLIVLPNGKIYPYPLAGTILIIKEIYHYGEYDLKGLSASEKDMVLSYLQSKRKKIGSDSFLLLPQKSNYI